MIYFNRKLLTKTSRGDKFQLSTRLFVEYFVFILRRFPVNVVHSPLPLTPRRREQFNYYCYCVAVLRVFFLLLLLLLHFISNLN